MTITIGVAVRGLGRVGISSMIVWHPAQAAVTSTPVAARRFIPPPLLETASYTYA
jgi:hypothetical protein